MLLKLDHLGADTIMKRLPSVHEIGVNFANVDAVSYTHLRAHETVLDLVCRLLLEKKYILTPDQTLAAETNYTFHTDERDEIIV